MKHTNYIYTPSRKISTVTITAAKVGYGLFAGLGLVVFLSQLWK